MIDGNHGTRISSSIEEDGSLLLAAINEKNRNTPGKVATSVIPLSEQARKALRKTAEQILAVIDDPDNTHIAIEIHGE